MMGWRHLIHICNIFYRVPAFQGPGPNGVMTMWMEEALILNGNTLFAEASQAGREIGKGVFVQRWQMNNDSRVPKNSTGTMLSFQSIECGMLLLILSVKKTFFSLGEVDCQFWLQYFVIMKIQPEFR